MIYLNPSDIKKIINDVNNVNTRFLDIPKYILNRYFIQYDKEETVIYDIIISKLVLASNLFNYEVNNIIISYIIEKKYFYIFYTSYIQNSFLSNVNRFYTNLFYMSCKKIKNYDFLNPIYYTYEEIINIASYTLDIINYFKHKENIKIKYSKGGYSKGGYSNKNIKKEYKPSLFNSIHLKYRDKYYFNYIDNTLEMKQFESKIIPLFKRSLLLKEIRELKYYLNDKMIEIILSYIDNIALLFLNDEYFVNYIGGTNAFKTYHFQNYNNSYITCSWCDKNFRYCDCK